MSILNLLLSQQQIDILKILGLVTSIEQRLQNFLKKSPENIDSLSQQISKEIEHLILQKLTNFASVYQETDKQFWQENELKLEKQMEEKISSDNEAQEQTLFFQEGITWLQGQEAQRRFLAWIQGQTGYPLVDACMRQLLKSGWLHNRGRMLVASILTKNLGIDWRWGQEYFRAVLLDLDEASNNGGWQWAASVGADPKPIRIFNPYLQAENYDKEAKYQNYWFSQDDEIYQNLQNTRNKRPIIEHALARKEALKRYHLDKDSQVRDF